MEHLLWIAWHDRDAKCVTQARTLSSLSGIHLIKLAGWPSLQMVCGSKYRGAYGFGARLEQQCLPMYQLTCMVINARHSPCSWSTSLRGWGRRCIAHLLLSAWASY